VSRLRVLEGRFAVARPDAADGLPAWFDLAAPLAAAVRRADELSLVCPERDVPAGVVAERDWAALEVAGPMDLALTGVLAAIAAPLAGAGVPVFALATYDTDVVLVPAARLGDACAALRAAGHDVEGPSL
jgi:uncharacterized protein